MYVCMCVCVCVCVYSKYVINLAILVEGNSKAPFSLNYTEV